MSEIIYSYILKILGVALFFYGLLLNNTINSRCVSASFPEVMNVYFWLATGILLITFGLIREYRGDEE